MSIDIVVFYLHNIVERRRGGKAPKRPATRERQLAFKCVLSQARAHLASEGQALVPLVRRLGPAIHDSHIERVPTFSDGFLYSAGY